MPIVHLPQNIIFCENILHATPHPCCNFPIVTNPRIYHKEGPRNVELNDVVYIQVTTTVYNRFQYSVTTGNSSLFLTSATRRPLVSPLTLT